MTRTRRNYGILAVGVVLINSLTYINYQQDAMLPFSLLFLPLIILAGYWEETIGALAVTVVSVLTMVALNLLRIVDPKNAMVAVVTFGMAFGLVALINYDRERKHRRRLEELTPKEQELAAVQQRVNTIREQIEGYEKRLRGLIKVYQVTKVLGGMIKLVPMLDEARLIVSGILSSHFRSANTEPARLAIYIPDEESSDFVRTGSRGLEISDEGFPEKITAKHLKRWLGEDLNSVLIEDLRQEERFRPFAEQVTFRALMAVPLVLNDIVIGVLMMGANKPASFSAQEFNKIEVLGRQIALALKKVFLYRKVQKLSVTDSLTGLYVRRFFHERLNEEIIRAKRYQQQLCLLMLDLDHFKEVNDQFGHQQGDTVLMEVARRLQTVAGQTALVARYGGEEFAVILPNTSAKAGSELGKIINRHMKASPISLAGGQGITLTISIGVSAFPALARDQDNLLASADQALYQAKHEGRDRVVVFQG